MSELTHAAIQKLKVAELKVELTKRGLDVKGKKDDLVQRLLESIKEVNQDQEEISNDSVDHDMEETENHEKLFEENPVEEKLILEQNMAEESIITEKNLNVEENTTVLNEAKESIVNENENITETAYIIDTREDKTEEENIEENIEENKFENSEKNENSTIEDSVVSTNQLEDSVVPTNDTDELAEFTKVNSSHEESMEELPERETEEGGASEDVDKKSVELTTKHEQKEEKCLYDDQDSEDEEIDYVCPPEFDEREEMRKMFCGGLDKATTDEQFKELFSKFGEITDFIIIRKENSKSDRLFGFVTFAKCDDLEQCLLSRPHKFLDKELDVKRAVPRGQDDSTGHFKVKKLHVANIPEDFKAKELKTYLKSRHPSKFGKIEEINFLKTKDEEGNLTDKNRGFGFITVSNEDYADRIAIAESKFTLSGHSMRISKAKPRVNEAGAMRGAYRKPGYNQGWDDWSGYGGYGYNQGYGGYGYGQGYGAYDYYGSGYGSYGYSPQRTARGGNRFNPY